jgi:hypothetical protein
MEVNHWLYRYISVHKILSTINDVNCRNIKNYKYLSHLRQLLYLSLQTPKPLNEILLFALVIIKMAQIEITQPAVIKKPIF